MPSRSGRSRLRFVVTRCYEVWRSGCYTRRTELHLEFTSPRRQHYFGVEWLASSLSFSLPRHYRPLDSSSYSSSQGPGHADQTSTPFLCSMRCLTLCMLTLPTMDAYLFSRHVTSDIRRIFRYCSAYLSCCCVVRIAWAQQVIRGGGTPGDYQCPSIDHSLCVCHSTHGR